MPNYFRSVHCRDSRGRSDRWDVMKGRTDMDKDKVIMDTILVSILDLEILCWMGAPDFSLGKLVANIVFKKAPDICYPPRFP